MGIEIAGRGIRVMPVDSHRLAVCGLQRVIDDESRTRSGRDCDDLQRPIAAAEQARPMW